MEVCLSWGWGGECLSSDYWLHDYGWDVASVTPMAVPAPVSVTPGSGGGPTQTFQLQYAAASGAAHIAEGWLWIDATGAAGHTSCVVQYKTADHTLYLLNDAGTAWTSGAIGVGPLLQNSQCAVNPLAAGASASGNTWTVNVPITFAAGYAGAKSVWLYASGPAGASGWQLLGTWTARARVDSAWPSPGVVGGTLTVQGLGLGSGQGTSTVTVNGVSASESSWSDTTIAATVPAGATTGPMVVTTGRYNSVMSTRLPPTSLSLTEPSTRPYFLWWTDATVADLRARLRDADPAVRAYWLGALLREANTRDVWLFVTPGAVRDAWPLLQRHLGRSRGLWAYLLGLPEAKWPPRTSAV